MLTLDQFDYHLPAERIAQQPAEPRDHSRLLVVNRTNETFHHHHFFDLPQLLKSTDVLVRNNTKVIPARIFGHKESGGKVEILLAHRLKIFNSGEEWEVLTKPGLKPGQTVFFENSELTIECLAINEMTRIVRLNQTGHQLFESLYQIGHTPLPPYIEWSAGDSQRLRELYQTTYAKIEGSAAAPTAGLHFTPELDEQLKSLGIAIEEVTLHVGLGTFLPVKTANITEHQMHHEWYEVKADTADRLNQARQAGQRIIAVGTTTARTLETVTDTQGITHAGEGETAIFIYPPYKFNGIDALITNFHLPKSTLLMMIAAFASQPNTSIQFTNFNDSLIGQAYQEAIEKGYRFFSFGDAMLIE